MTGNRNHITYSHMVNLGVGQMAYCFTVNRLAIDDQIRIPSKLLKGDLGDLQSEELLVA